MDKKVILILGIATFVIFVGGVFLISKPPGNSGSGAADDSTLLGDMRNSVGSESALVTVVEFSDYQCPFCQRHFTETLPKLMADYVDTGKVRYVFKDFPLTQIHPHIIIFI